MIGPMTTLDVLVIESDRGVGAGAAEALVRAGHRVHRCHDDQEAAFPCVGVTEPRRCPLDRVDAALVVHAGGTTELSIREEGASCVLRAGLPVVALAPATAAAELDPWLADRVGDEAAAVGAVASAVAAAAEERRRAVVAMCAPLLAEAGIDPAAVGCEIVREGHRLHAQIDLPAPVDEPVRQALAVRALAALGAADRPHDSVGVAVRWAS